jgi:hypothetical protein
MQPAAPEIEAALERVLRSPSFQTVARLRRFLQYVVQEALAGRAEEIKEYSIGVSAYGRGIRFDPRCDGIVRVDAINLRKRLFSYYQKEGVDDNIVISIPKGAYAPVFRARDAVAPVDMDDAEEACWRARCSSRRPTELRKRIGRS